MKKRKQYMAGAMLLIAAMVLQLVGVGNTGKVLAANEGYETNGGVVQFSEGDASISIKGNAGQSLVGKNFEVHKLFEAENAKGLESIDYTINEVYVQTLKTVVGDRLGKNTDEVTEYELIDYMQSMNSYLVEGARTEQTLESSYSDYRFFIEDVAREIKTNAISGLKVTVQDVKQDNSIEIKGLTYGYYMVIDSSESGGKHTAASLSMLSTANPEAQIRIKADYPTVTKKLLEDDNPEVIGNDGWNDIGDYEIGQAVPYRITSTIPNLNGYHNYYFAWHDRMDEALTLRSDSIQIQITGQINSEEKTYQLTQEEYHLLQDASDATFVIEVADIKSIIDREFPNIDERKENSYGQQIIVTYEALLNDKAALDTGRPGFENDVRLEFSNNPSLGAEEETGFTPWDTVVCFTYQLNGVKVNNYGMNLKDAAFRLYSDEACQNEIYVKQVASRYHVMHPDSWEDGKCENAVEIVSDENGEFDICGLDGGVYYLKEVTAPSGYRPLAEPIKLQVSPTYCAERNHYVKGEASGDTVVQLSASAHITMYQNGETKESDVELEVNQEKGSMYLSIVNEVGEKLPITGSAAMLLLALAGAGLMSVAVACGRKKHE